MALAVDTAALYVARCGCETECAWAEGFAPDGALAQSLLRSMSLGQILRLPQVVARVIRWSLAPHVAVQEIFDGNVNFSFQLSCHRGCTLFLKHATGFLKWHPQMALEAERMKREVSYYRDVARVLGEDTAREFQPALLHFDEDCMVLVLQFLVDHELLIERCFTSADGVPAPAAHALGRYLGLVHASTLEKEGREVESAERAVTYWNHQLRAVQLEHVFTVCYQASPQGRALAAGDADFMAEVAELKSRYLGYGTGGAGQRALCHGDCHAGSVMVAADGLSVKVIDPEFAVFAPPGLDVGSLLFALVCGFIFRVQQPAPINSGDDETLSARGGRTAATDSLRDAIQSVWASYSSEMLAAGTTQAELRRLGEDAVGYAMCEVVRTSLGFAGARDPGRRLHSPEAVLRYQDVAVRLAQRCMNGRRTAEPLADASAPMELLVRELEEARLEEDKLGPFRIMPDASSTRTNGNGSGHDTS